MKFYLDRLILLTNSALFDENYTVGQEGLIASLKDNIGVIVCYIISAVGFVIVAAAIIRNALAGLYLAYPKLWDKVHKVKQQLEDGFEKSATGGEKWKKVSGSIMMILISALPDVKDATDFSEDENGNSSSGNDKFRKKQWLITAIPEFLTLVMIGMLIYYGYPTKLANWVGETGRFALDAFFDNVDPIQLTKNVFDGIATYELATDSATSTAERNINGIVRSAVKQMYTRYSDMHQQPLQQTATLLEQDILTDFYLNNDLATILEEPDGLTVSYAVQLTSTSPNINKVFSLMSSENAGQPMSGKLYGATSTSGVRQFKYIIKADKYPTGSTKVGALDYILITINATPKSQTVVNSIMATAHVGNFEVATSNTSFSINGINFNYTGGIYTTSGAPVTVKVFDKAGQEKFKTSGTLEIEGISASVSFGTNKPLGDLSVALTTAGEGSYVEVILPNKSYTTYTTTSGQGAEITSKMTVYALRLPASGGTNPAKWLNVGDSGYSMNTSTKYDNLESLVNTDTKYESTVNTPTTDSGSGGASGNN